MKNKRMMKVKKTLMMTMMKTMRKNPNQINLKMMIPVISSKEIMIFHQTERMTKRMKFL